MPPAINLPVSASVFVLFKEVKPVSGSGRIPLWIVATVAGIGVLTVVGTFFYGAYAGLGSAM